MITDAFPIHTQATFVEGFLTKTIVFILAFTIS